MKHNFHSSTCQIEDFVSSPNCKIKRQKSQTHQQNSDWIYESAKKKVKSEHLFSDAESINEQIRSNQFKNKNKFNQIRLDGSMQKNFLQKNRFIKFNIEDKSQSKPQIKSESKDKQALRNKFNHLIENHKVPDSFPREIKNIIYVQAKLDDYLLFLKNNRNKKLGQSFKQIKKRLLIGSQAYLTMTMFKQILYIAPHFYEINFSHSNDDHPYLIKLTAKTQQTERRKIQFKRLITKFVMNKKKEIIKKDEDTLIQIPQYEIKLKFHKQSQILLSQLNEQKKKLFQPKQTIQLKPIDILDKSFDFRQKLYALIKQRQIKNNTQILQNQNKSLEINKKQIEVITSEIYKIFSAKNVSNIFYTSLIQNLQSKVKMFISKNKIAVVIKEIQEKAGLFLKILNHSKGQIVQVNRKKYSQARNMLGFNS